MCVFAWLLFPFRSVKIYINSVSLASPDSGVGAGIDSYYEYLMKAYVLLGDNVYLERFNTVRPSLSTLTSC